MGGRGARSGLVLKSNRPIEPGNENDEAQRALAAMFPGLDAYPLVYSDDDPTLSGTVRQVVTAFEKKYYRKPEYCLLVGKNGETIDAVRGGEIRADISGESLQKAEVFTHTHARSVDKRRIIGGTFSLLDLNAWLDTNCRTFRAAAIEGTYSISKGPGFRKAGVGSYFARAERECFKRWKSEQAEIDRSYQRGEMSPQKYAKDCIKAENRLYVEFHNKLIEGATEYGYIYRLEKG